MAPSSTIYPEAYPPALNESETTHLVQAIKEWSISHGLAVRPPAAFTQQDPDGNLATTAPVTLFPSCFPRECFHEALMIQRSYNEAYAALARDEEWLGNVVQELLPVDDFIAKLWDVHVAVKKEGYVQPLTLGLFRSDYMVHMDASSSSPKPQIRQVEFNTIASSFGGLASRVSSLHSYLLQSASFPLAAASTITPASLPSNSSITGLAAGLASAHTAYGPSKSGAPVCILFIVQSPERNVFDQKHIEYALFSHLASAGSSATKVFRLAFPAILAHTRLDASRTLLYTPPAFPERTYEVSTVYLRAGYSPDEYTATPDAWPARLHLERSAAIKCPSILTHLAGSKKVQQILATPASDHLERFLAPALAARVRATFAPMYPLDASPAGQTGRALALDPATATHYVLKPQREGGGNNVYRAAIPGFLRSLREEAWAAHVLMEMIEPPAQRNVILRNGAVQAGGVICELGVYGACLWDTRADVREGWMLRNEEAGYLLRTKGDQSEEGGVAAGFGAVDSVVLVDV